MRPLVFVSIAFLAVTVLACSSSSSSTGSTPPPAGDRVTEEENGTCPSPSSILRGTKQAGDACTEGADCAPVCCPCNNPSNRAWLAVHCKSGVCVGAPDVCTDTANPTELCQ